MEAVDGAARSLGVDIEAGEPQLKVYDAKLLKLSFCVEIRLPTLTWCAPRQAGTRSAFRGAADGPSLYRNGGVATRARMDV